MNKLNKIQHAALLDIQWRNNDMNGKGNYCPYCLQYESKGHGSDCKIGNAIKAYEDAIAATKLVEEG